MSHFTADKKLIAFVTEKVSKLELFFDNIIACEVYLRLDKSSEKENKLAEIKLLIPGKTLLAKKQCKTFEEAFNTAFTLRNLSEIVYNITNTT